MAVTTAPIEIDRVQVTIHPEHLTMEGKQRLLNLFLQECESVCSFPDELSRVLKSYSDGHNDVAWLISETATLVASAVHGVLVSQTQRPF